MIRTIIPPRKPLVRTRLSKKIKNKRYSKQYYIDHKKEIKQHNKQWYIDHKEERKQHKKQWHLKYKHNLTPEQREEMYAKQNGCCAICGRHESEFKRDLGIDHNHNTMKNRGLLCYGCNLVIGYAYENISILKSAISYLEKHQ